MQKIWAGGQTETNSINQREEGTLTPHSTLENPRSPSSQFQRLFGIAMVKLQVIVNAMVRFWSWSFLTSRSSSHTSKMAGVAGAARPQNFGKFRNGICGERANGVSNPICFDQKCYRLTLIVNLD